MSARPVPDKTRVQSVLQGRPHLAYSREELALHTGYDYDALSALLGQLVADGLAIRSAAKYQRPDLHGSHQVWSSGRPVPQIRTVAPPATVHLTSAERVLMSQWQARIEQLRRANESLRGMLEINAIGLRGLRGKAGSAPTGSQEDGLGQSDPAEPAL